MGPGHLRAQSWFIYIVLSRFQYSQHHDKHCSSCSMRINMNLIFTVAVDVLTLWVPGHPQTQSWSPNGTLLCQHFSIHMYSDKHCRSYFMHIKLICAVPVYVKAVQMQGHPQPQCWSHKWILFCLYCSMHLNLDKHCGCSSSFMHTTWPLRCMWMFCPCRCQAIHTLWADHVTHYCSATFSVPTY